MWLQAGIAYGAPFDLAYSMLALKHMSAVSGRCSTLHQGRLYEVAAMSVSRPGQVSLSRTRAERAGTCCHHSSYGAFDCTRAQAQSGKETCILTQQRALPCHLMALSEGFYEAPSNISRVLLQVNRWYGRVRRADKPGNSDPQGYVSLFWILYAFVAV